MQPPAFPIPGAPPAARGTITPGYYPGAPQAPQHPSQKVCCDPNALAPQSYVPALVCLDGRTFINPAKYAQKVYYLSVPDGSVTIPADKQTRANFEPPADQGGSGVVELHDLFANFGGGAFAVELYSSIYNRALMNGPVEASLIFGTPQLPARMKQPILVPSTTSLDATWHDLSGGANTVSPVIVGHQWVDPQGRIGTPYESAMIEAGRLSHPFWLVPEGGAQVTIAANATTTVRFRVPGDADLYATGILARAFGTAGDLTVQIFEGQRRALMDRALRLDLIASLTQTGTTGWQGGAVHAASLPYEWPFAHVFQRRSILEFRVTNSGAEQNLSLAIPGQLLYHQPASRPVYPGEPGTLVC